MGFIDKIVHKLDDQYNGIEYRNDKITEIKKIQVRNNNLFSQVWQRLTQMF